MQYRYVKAVLKLSRIVLIVFDIWGYATFIKVFSLTWSITANRRVLMQNKMLMTAEIQSSFTADYLLCVWSVVLRLRSISM